MDLNNDTRMDMVVLLLLPLASFFYYMHFFDKTNKTVLNTLNFYFLVRGSMREITVLNSSPTGRIMPRPHNYIYTKKIRKQKITNQENNRASFIVLLTISL